MITDCSSTTTTVLVAELKRKLEASLGESDNRGATDGGGVGGDLCEFDRQAKKLATAGSPTSVDVDEFIDMVIDGPTATADPVKTCLAPRDALRMGPGSLLACRPMLDHHVGLLLRESEQQRYLRTLLHKVMSHSKNRNIFNFPVDDKALCLYNYRTVVKNPNDLGSVKERLLSLAYPDWGAFRKDVRLVFNNAMAFNPEKHHVHGVAKFLLDFFEEEYEKVLSKHISDIERRIAHACDLCHGVACSMCREKCLTVEPPVLACAGPCGLRLKRGGIFYVTTAGDRLWCQRCHITLPATLPPPDVDTGGLVGSQCTLKKNLLKRCYDDVSYESWIDCSVCRDRFHEICVLYDGDVPRDQFKCAACTDSSGCEPARVRIRAIRLDDVRNRALDNGSAAAGGEVRAGVTPGLPPGVWHAVRQQDSRSAPPFSQLAAGVRTAAQLRETRTSRFIQAMVRRRLAELGERAVADSVTVRVLSMGRFNHAVPPTVVEHFGAQGGGAAGGGSGGGVATYRYEYLSKAVYMFQRLDGVDTAFFCMYVQEYGPDAPGENAMRGYVAYLDSVDVFRPRTARTAVYHEALLAYIAELRLRNFRGIHLWSCPPQRGNDFIFWCHPAHQRSPGADRLRDWYFAMSEEAERRGTVVRRDNLFDMYFRDGRAVEALPPIFDGDFWVAEADRVARRRGFTNSSGKPLPMDSHCKYILLNLMSQRGAEFFTEPVDPVALNAPNYFELITRPMDLGTVLAKLAAGAYAAPADMAADVFLAFDNAMAFNPKSHPVHRAAAGLRVQFARDFENLVRTADPSDMIGMESYCSSSPAAAPAPAPSAASPSSASSGSGTPRFSKPPAVGDEPLSVTAATAAALAAAAAATAAGGPAAGAAATAGSPLARSVANSVEKHKLNLLVLELQHRCSLCRAFIPLLPSTAPAAAPVACAEPSCAGCAGASGPADGRTDRRPVGPARFFACADCMSSEEARGRVAARHDLALLRPFAYAPPTVPPPYDARSDAEPAVLAGCGGGSAGDGPGADVLLSLFQAETAAEPAMSHPLVDSRHAFLGWCQTLNLQFDSLRRAKYSTAIILRHLDQPDEQAAARALQLRCNACAEPLPRTRWRCSTCHRCDLCEDCVLRLSDADPHTVEFVEHSQHAHVLTPYNSAC